MTPPHSDAAAPRDPPRPPALVVGVGASAGGLDALEKLFAAVPDATGIAFVVVQHLDRRHPSLLAELLGRHTRLPVRQAEDGMRPEADHVYVIAPNTALTLEGGALRVRPWPDESPVGRIDAFLCSLARERGERAAGVILSGAGSDGVSGLRAVKEGGGLVLAQEPRTATHGSMPGTAVEAGVVDQVLEVERMPAALVEHARLLASGDATEGGRLDAELAAGLGAICGVLQQRTGHDFSRYKEGTLLRRLRRRLRVRHAASAAQYLRILEEDPVEPQRLLRELLIGVTQFFRDPDVFDAIAREVLPRIVGDKAPDAPVRVWVPGCATGEEAYSLAMLVLEHLGGERGRRFIQIFATDLDPEVVAAARAGRYPDDVAAQLSPDRLERFFVRDAAGWRVSNELRDLCIFSVHSIIRDPPFSSLDLVSCRNVLIYLQPDLQKRVIPLFHYALRDGGYLILGPAEGLATSPELFEPASAKHRIFRRKRTAGRPHVEFPLAPRSPRVFEPPPAAPAASPPPTPREKVTATIERMLLDDYAPACAVVNERGDVEFVAGRIGAFLAPPAGAPSGNLLDMVRDSLRRELRGALHAAAATGARAVRDGVPVELEDGVHRLRVTVRPVPGGAGLFAVVLQERAGERVEALDAVAAAEASPALEQVESELRTTRADLKTATESAEAANEELRSANEELISTNEELQSANEELQTSKEELQSLNEELETVNAELRQKVDELAVANGDLQNLFASTEIATLFLDKDLRVSRFTPAATALFRLIDADLGRPIDDLAPRFHGTELVDDAREVLRTLKPVEREARAADGSARFMVRVLPYRTVENVVSGVVVTFVDVTALMRAEEALRRALARAEEGQRLLEALMEYVPEGITIADAPDVRIRMVSRYGRELAGKRRDVLEGIPLGEHARRWEIYERDGVTLARDEALPLTRATRDGEIVRDEEWVIGTPDGRRVPTLCSAGPIRDASGALVGGIIAWRDITDRKEAERAVLRSRQGLSRLADASLRVLAKTDLPGMLQEVAEAALSLTGARLAACGHGYVSGRFLVGGSARAPGAPACPPGDMFRVEKGGVHMALAEGADAIRLTDAELRAHPRWWGLPADHVPMRGLLGVRMVGRDGQTCGMLLVTDKEQGDFSEQDETLLRQLATVASLALQHVEARISLEESDRSKNHFLAILSHELRNPLAPIRNSLTLLDGAAPGSEQARRAQRVIERQVGQLTRLVDDLLDVTRISRGKIQLRRERLDLVEVVRRVVEDLRASFANSRVELELSAAEGPLWTVGDRTRLAQIVANLLENSAKFTDPGGKATVAVEASPSLGQAVVRVRDTGAGIAPDVLPRVFEPFMQGDTTLERSKGGLGLGLALVKGLAELHDGTVSVESAGPGKGAEFTVRFPLAPPEAVAAGGARAAARPGPRRILVIDDNVDSAESLRDVLALRGHAAEVAFSGHEGLEKARAFRPDVVFCDIGLPGMDGYDVARALRGDPALRRARLVALTGYATPDDVARARAAGFDAHLAKPQTMEMIEDALGAERPGA